MLANLSIRESLVGMYDFSQFKSLVQITDQSASPLLFDILKEYPKLNGLIFAEPLIVDKIKSDATQEIKSRCRFSSGNFYKHIPFGFKIYLLDDMLNRINEEQIKSLFSNISKSTEQYCRVILTFDKKEKSSDYYEKLLKSFNFVLTNVIYNDDIGMIETLKM
ncbi:MAG: hypothetical protein H7263_00430 [Candidatus Sericytochromatia bacterium]|nr:hypothetical protein [Candidatus Sericytochromatia bacterium]